MKTTILPYYMDKKNRLWTEGGGKFLEVGLRALTSQGRQWFVWF